MRRESIMPLLLKGVKSLRSSLCKVSLQPRHALCNVTSHGYVFSMTSGALPCLRYLRMASANGPHRGIRASDCQGHGQNAKQQREYTGKHATCRPPSCALGTLLPRMVLVCCLYWTQAA